MKRQLLPVFLTLSSLVGVESQAQLTVKGNTAFVYVGNELLFVKEDVNLEQGNLYLRRDGQLLQGTNASGAKTFSNKGTGELSAFVYSKNTNKYNYTSYGIPVRGKSANATSVAQNADVRQLIYVPSSVTSSNIATYVTNGGNATTGGLSIESRFVAWYNPGNSYAQWRYPILQTANSVIKPGFGLYFKGSNGSDATTAGESSVNRASTSTGVQRYDMRGIPNDGDIVIGTASEPLVGGAMYLLGNPYPSAFDLNQFMYDNRDVIETVEFYEELQSNTHTLVEYQFGYGVYTMPNGITSPGLYTPPTTINRPTDNFGDIYETNPNTNSITPRTVSQFLPIGKGFWVKLRPQASLPAGASIKFNNKQRVYKTAALNEFRNGVNPGQGVGNLVARQTNRNTNGEEFYGNYPEIPNLRGIDYTQLSMEPAPSFNILSSSGTLDSNLALAFSANASSDYITLEDAIINDDSAFFTYVDFSNNRLRVSTQPFDINQRFPFTIHSNSERVVDVKVNSFINFNLADEIYLHDISTGIYYDIKNNVAQVNVPAGITAGKYEITFKRDSQLNVDQNNLINAFAVLQNNKDKVLTISNPEMIEMTSAKVFDIQGKLMFSKESLGTDTEYKISTSSFADGVYIINIGTNIGKPVSKKVIVKN